MRSVWSLLASAVFAIIGPGRSGPAHAAEAQAQAKGRAPAVTSTTKISARLVVEPAVWSAAALQDITIRMLLKNEGVKTAVVYPLAAKSIGRTSIASEGIEWSLEAKSANGMLIPVQEIRTYFGPPGEPRSAEWLKEHGKVELSAGREHETKIEACWVPNALLKPEQLDPAMLDPQGMDGIGPLKLQLEPDEVVRRPLSESFSLARASVLIVGTTCKAIRKTLGTQRDALRGRVVGFFPAAGQYLLEARYLQNSWMGIGEKLVADAAPVRVSVGASP